MTCVAEVPAFAVQGWVLARVSTEALLHFVLFCYALRLWLYWLLPAVSSTPWAVLGIELLHGVCFGCAGGAVRERAG
jgi:hypothetical protein